MKVFEPPSNQRGIPSESNKSELKCRTAESSEHHRSGYQVVSNNLPIKQAPPFQVR